MRDDLYFLPLLSLPYTHFSLLARCQALLRRIAEHCSWEKASPKLKDPDRLPDPSTVRRWSSGLDSSQPALSFLNRTVTRVADWLARGHQVLDEAGPLSWITPTLEVLCPLRLREKSFHPPSLPGIADAVLLRLAPEEKGAVGEDVETLKRRMPLIEDLRQHNVFLLLRRTGMRIGECADLSFDCLRSIGPDQWAIHVPLGKPKPNAWSQSMLLHLTLVQRLRFFRSLDPLPLDGLLHCASRK